MSASHIWSILMGLAAVLTAGFAGAGEDYQPAPMQKNRTAVFEELTIEDASRKRQIPLRIYLPEGQEPVPVILLSHGLGGSRSGGTYLGTHWSAQGYVVVAMQHAGSDESVWKDKPLRNRMQAMKDAASVQNTVDRYRDVKFVLDQLQDWKQAKEHAWAERLDMSQVGMSGHSYGAATTQGVSGQTLGLGGTSQTDKRIQAALMLSPNIPRRGDPQNAFASVKVPWMLMTGTRDTSPINTTSVEDRLGVYPALPDSIDRYELVLHEALHSAFSDGNRRRRNDHNPEHHPRILALSTAFWDAHLKQDAAARKWLHGSEVRELLAPEDRWQMATKGNVQQDAAAD